MTWTMRNPRAVLVAATFAGVLLSLPHISPAAAQPPSQASVASVSAPEVNPVASDATARLKKKEYRNVTVSVNQGIVILNGV